MKNSGNALFLILIAVALFAALSYAVTQSGRGGGAIDRETLQIEVARVLEYAASMQKAVERMQLINGCSDYDISFEHSFIAGYEHTPAARDDCKIFHVDGGGISYMPPPEFCSTLLWRPQAMLTCWFI